MTVRAFDFDGTLTWRDTFLAFLCQSAGWWRFAAAMFRCSLLLIGMKLRLVSVQRAKEAVFTRLFAGMPLAEFDALCARFARENGRLFRPRALEAVRGFAASDGEAVIVVSASLENYVAPFFAGLPVVVEATRVEADARGVLTGRFLGGNCKGAEKVRRILARFPDRAAYRLVSYGDSPCDREMLAFSDEAHFRPFR